MSLTTGQIQAVSRLVGQLTGIQWDSSKEYLIESRLQQRLPDFGCRTIDELISRVQAGDARLRTAFIDAVTTRETLFFRDQSPFLALEHKALPELIDARSSGPLKKRLRFWSAACSTGQEPYSIAMLLLELLPDIHQWDVQIMASDISDAALSTASRGEYSAFETGRGLSPELLKRYFIPCGTGWKVTDEVRSLVSFEKRNLLQPFTGLGPFDVIFCRNVAIYFDLPTRRTLFERLAAVLPRDGCLFAGAGENLSEFGARWTPQFHCRSVFYQPNQTAPGQFTAQSARPRPQPVPSGLAPLR